jgi:hypothetical protein
MRTAMPRQSSDRLAFKMASDALRLWFDFRFGCRDGLRGQAFVTGEYPTPRGMGVADELSLACSRLWL